MATTVLATLVACAIAALVPEPDERDEAAFLTTHVAAVWCEIGLAAAPFGRLVTGHAGPAAGRTGSAARERHAAPGPEMPSGIAWSGSPAASVGDDR